MPANAYEDLPDSLAIGHFDHFNCRSLLDGSALGIAIGSRVVNHGTCMFALTRVHIIAAQIKIKTRRKRGNYYSQRIVRGT